MIDVQALPTCPGSQLSFWRLGACVIQGKLQLGQHVDVMQCPQDLLHGAIPSKLSPGRAPSEGGILPRSSVGMQRHLSDREIL